MRHGQGDTFIVLELHRNEFIQAPAKWCNGKSTRRKFNISNTLRTCFPKFFLSKNSVVKRSLRLIRDALALSEIRYVMTFGSLLGSLRYHKRMPFDCDFDLQVHREDHERALQALLKLASDPTSQMRVFDLTPAGANAKVGLACGRSTSWMNPDNWTEFGPSVTFYNGIPTVDDWDLFLKVMGSCGTYVDIYTNTNDDMVLDRLSEYQPIYRPLEGTLFRVFDGAHTYLEETYGVSLDMCVPKIPLVVRGRYKFLPPECRNLVVPCSRLDTLYPRVFKFTTATPPTMYELGLKSDRRGKCWIRSIFLIRS
ncbi:unnamed protein product [Mesocestoides corti]|nr:unnamed protein product [Mesocestoides corti]